MPRPRLIRSDTFAYHVSVRVNNRDNYPLPLKRCWRIFAAVLAKSQMKYDVKIHAFVMMSNHLHLLISTPKQNIDRFMGHFESVSSVRIANASGRSNHVYGARYKWTLIDSARAFAYVAKYIYRNPVRAGIRSRVEEYEFSTLLNAHLPFDLDIKGGSYWAHVPCDLHERLTWLNLPTPKEQEDLLRRALRRRNFKFTTDHNFQAALRGLRASYGVE